jgi:hypothetical protein
MTVQVALNLATWEVEVGGSCSEVLAPGKSKRPSLKNKVKQKGLKW